MAGPLPSAAACKLDGGASTSAPINTCVATHVICSRPVEREREQSFVSLLRLAYRSRLAVLVNSAQ